MKAFVKGALALSAFGAILAGCNGGDDDGGPSAGATATATATSGGTANATATRIASATATAIATQNGTPGPTASPFPTTTPTPGAGPNLNVVALVALSGPGPGGGTAYGLNVVNASNPRRILREVFLPSLPGFAAPAGIDYRPADGKLYLLGRDRRLYIVSTGTGAVTRVGSGFSEPEISGLVGFDFNPVADRIRVVTSERQNFRLNPASGGVVDSNAALAGFQPDPSLFYDPSDRSAGRVPSVSAAAYTNNVRGATSTTNYAIDSGNGNLVTQGTRAGVTPAVSPNTGRLFTVGSLGLPLANNNFFNVSFDIGRGDAALASVNSVLYNVNLATGRATRIDDIGIRSDKRGRTVIGLAIVP